MMSPVRAVIADDSADVRLALRTMLEARSDIAVVAEAADGEQALAAVGTTDPDVLLLDLSLPVIDGLAVLRRLRDTESAVTVVALSGYGRDRVAATALELGAAAFVEKGGATRGLLEMLDDLFPGRIGPAPRRRTPAPSGLRPAPDAASMLLPGAVATAVHALRGPLAILTDTAAELIDGRDRLTSGEVDVRLSSLLRNARAAQRVLNALEDCHRAGADGLGLVPQPVRLADLVRAALPDLRRLAGDHPIELVVTDDVLVAADPLRLRQVIENLVSNAGRFSACGAPIELVVGSHGAQGALLVVDHGPGIDADAMHELFRRFARADRPEVGTGLGLYVAQRIARAHGGDLDLVLTGPEGSTFRITLPAVAAVRAVGSV